jgi:hypothetical protein
VLELFRLINLVEFAAVVEVAFLRIAPAAEYIVDREQLDRLVIGRELSSSLFRCARAGKCLAPIDWPVSEYRKFR